VNQCGSVRPSVGLLDPGRSYKRDRDIVVSRELVGVCGTQTLVPWVSWTQSELKGDAELS
jgi:hypothetical protein